MNNTQSRMGAVAVRLRRPKSATDDSKPHKNDNNSSVAKREAHGGRWKPIAISAVAAATMMVSAVQASASDVFMAVGSYTSQPIGHYEYCQVASADCRIIAKSTEPMKLTRARWAEVVEINHRVNTTVRAVTDQDLFGMPEYWVLPKDAGDCEDFALLKRKMLMERGWPASTLLVTVVRQANGDAHAVLTVRTDRGDFILDNLEPKVLAWNDTEYRFLKRQAVRHSGKWESIDDRRPVGGNGMLAVRGQ